MATERTTYPLPKIVDRAAWQAEVDRVLVREKAHTREGDAIAAARRSLPMVEVDAATPLVGAQGNVPLVDVFEDAGNCSCTSTCGTTANLQRNSARDAHSSPVTRGSCRICTAAMSRTRRSARVRMRERAVPRLHGVGDAVVFGA